MQGHEVTQRILAEGMVAILRAESGEKLAMASEALFEGGVTIVEVTFTVPNAIGVLEEVRKRLGDKVVLGAGSVLDAETARAAILAGAQFIVSPVAKEDCVDLARRYGKPVIPGGYTPTEILAAYEMGADIVKLFPAQIGGPDYLRAVRAPLPQVPILPTGGVNRETLPEFFAAGAVAVGMGGNLVSKAMLETDNFTTITQRATEYVSLVKSARHT